MCKQQSFGVWPLQFIAFQCFSVVGFWDNWHCGKCVGGEVIRKVGSHCLGGAIHLHGHATCKPAYSLSQETDWPELSQKHVTTVERNVNCTLACTCNYCREKKGPDSRPYFLFSLDSRVEYFSKLFGLRLKLCRGASPLKVQNLETLLTWQTPPILSKLAY